MFYLYRKDTCKNVNMQKVCNNANVETKLPSALQHISVEKRRRLQSTLFIFIMKVYILGISFIKVISSQRIPG